MTQLEPPQEEEEPTVDKNVTNETPKETENKDNDIDGKNDIKPKVGQKSSASEKSSSSSSSSSSSESSDSSSSSESESDDEEAARRKKTRQDAAAIFGSGS